MKRLAPYRGTLFRLALTNALLVGVVALAFLYVENARLQRAGREGFTINSGRQAIGAALSQSRSDLPNEFDQEFIQAAAVLAWEEVRMAEFGGRRAMRPEVRGFARELAGQHKALRNEVEALATRKGVLLPTSESRSAETDAIATSSGRGFDERFIEWAKTRKSTALQLFERAATECRDPELRQFAGRMLPRLQAQHEHARRLRRAVY